MEDVLPPAASLLGSSPNPRGGRIEAMDTWASLPPDLVIEMLRRLEATAVVRCAAACKPWRRAIIGGAASLRPRPDRFVPGLLLGLFHWYSWDNESGARLRPVPGPFESVVLPSTADPGYELSSARDRFILLTARKAEGLCLSNPISGHCAFLPAASLNPSNTFWSPAAEAMARRCGCSPWRRGT